MRGPVQPQQHRAATTNAQRPTAEQRQAQQDARARRWNVSELQQPRIRRNAQQGKQYLSPSSTNPSSQFIQGSIRVPRGHRVNE